MKILVVNPNTTESFTRDIDVTAQEVKSAGTEVVCMNPLSGPPSIESDYDELMSVKPCLELILPIQHEYDGFVIACYGDHPAVHALREILTQPVVGIMEASLRLAAMIGHSFSIITSGDRAVSMFTRGVRAFGMQDHCASIRSTSTPVLALDSEHKADTSQLILNEARRAMAEDKAEVISLGCAGMVGLAEKMTKELGIPVIDGVAAGVKVIEALVGCGLRTSKRGAYAPIEPKEYLNFSPMFSNPGGA